MTGSGPAERQTQAPHNLGNMVVLWLVLPAALGAFFLGVFVWAVFEHFLTTDVPSALRHPAKFRFLHCIFVYVVTLVSWHSVPSRVGVSFLSLSLFLSLGPLEGQEGLFFFHLLSLSVFRPSQERQTLLHSGLSLSASPASVEEGGRLQEIEHLKMLVSWGSWNQAFKDTEGQMGDSPLFCVCYSVSLPLPFPSFLSPPPHPATSFSFLQQHLLNANQRAHF